MKSKEQQNTLFGCIICRPPPTLKHTSSSSSSAFMRSVWCSPTPKKGRAIAQHMPSLITRRRQTTGVGHHPPHHLPPTVKFSSPVLRVVWAAPPTLLIDSKISPCRWLAHCGLVMCMHPLVRYPESILTTSRSR